ncbi:MAG: 5'/3'-nucleotidase SurE [bacterium JZ-2024 1]
MSEPRILITNDDGFFSPSLPGFIQCLSEIGKVYAIVPEQERSAVSHAITLHKPLRIRRVRLDSFPVYVTNGTPADCVLLGRWEFFRDNPPDIVVSGVNRGPNVGIDSIYSGTVAAAREAAIVGIPAVAVSIADFNFPQHYETAYWFTVKLVSVLLGRPSWLPPLDKPERTFLNMNVPNLPLREVQGLKVTRPGRRRYVDVLERREDPRGETYYWITSSRIEGDSAMDSDSVAVASGFVSLCPVPVEVRSASHIFESLKPMEKLLTVVGEVG